MNLKLILYTCMLKMRHGKLSCLYIFLENIGVRIAISRFFNWRYNKKCHKQPTAAMESSKKYFAEHLSDVEDVTSFLSDDESRDVYMKVIEFRQTYNSRVLPKNSYRQQYFGNTFFRYDNERSCGGGYL